MDNRTLISGAAFAGLVVLGGSLYVGDRLAEANRHPVTAPPSPAFVPTPPPTPELDPAYAAGSIKIAAEMGITAAELRRRYQSAAEICQKTPEQIWGEHVRSSRHWGAEDALEMIPKHCQMMRSHP